MIIIEQKNASIFKTYSFFKVDLLLDDLTSRFPIIPFITETSIR